MFQNGILTTCCLKNCHLREAIIMTSLTRNDWQSERIKTKLKFQAFQTKLIEIKSRNSTFLSSGTSCWPFLWGELIQLILPLFSWEIDLVFDGRFHGEPPRKSGTSARARVVGLRHGHLPETNRIQKKDEVSMKTESYLSNLINELSYQLS